jgi:hypothetical protein
MIKDYNFQIEQLKDIMKRSPIDKKKISKITNYISPPNSVQQWIFTPKNVVFRPKILKLLKRLINQKICVIFNVEIIRYLLDFGYKLEQITFISDCKDRTILAKSWGIKQVIKYTELSNKSKMIKNMNFTVIMNPDFAYTSRFRKIAESIANKYIILFSDTNHFSKNKNNYNNVEYIENLGKDGFPDAEVSTIVSIINVKKSQKNNLKILVRKTDELVEDLIPAYLDYRNNRETQRRFRFWVNGSELSKSQTASLFEGIGETIHDFKSLKESLKLNGPKKSVKKKTTNKKIAKKKIQKILKKQNPKTKTKRK